MEMDGSGGDFGEPEETPIFQFEEEKKGVFWTEDNGWL
jgi:hypothetical protein